MKKSIIALSIMLLTACGEETETSAPIKEDKVTAFEEIKIKEEKRIEEEKKRIEEEKRRIEEEKRKEKERLEAEEAAKDVFKKYDFKTKVENKELQKLIDETILEYEGIVDQIRVEIGKLKEEAIKNREDNIKEIEEGLAEQKELFNKNCNKIDQSNEDSCNDISSNINDLENTIRKIETDIINENKKYETMENNELNKYKANLKTNVSKLVSQDR